MATTNYINMVDQIGAVTLNCPSAIIAVAIRDTVIDLCERGQIWKYIHPDVTLASPTYNYAFVMPDSQTVVSMIQNARLGKNGAYSPIDVTDFKTGLARAVNYPDTVNLAQPNTVWQTDQRNFTIAPTPDTVATYVLRLNTTLKPTTDSTGADSVMIAEHINVINHGALHRLLLQQKQGWFNSDLAGYHGKQYSYFLNQYKARAVKGYGQANVTTAMRPFA